MQNINEQLSSAYDGFLHHCAEITKPPLLGSSGSTTVEHAPLELKLMKLRVLFLLVAWAFFCFSFILLLHNKFVECSMLEPSKMCISLRCASL